MELHIAITEAIENNFELATDKIQATLPEFGVSISESDFRWKLFPLLSANTNSDGQGIFTAEASVEKKFSPGTQFELRGIWNVRESGENGEEVTIQIEQPLFKDFGKLMSYQDIDQAKYQLFLAQLGLHRQTESLILQVVNSFTIALNQSDRVDLEMAALIRAADLVRLVEVKVRQGSATTVDLLEMKMLHQEAELRFRQAEESLVIARASLAELLGRVHEQLPPLASVELEPLDLPSLAESEKLAREHRPERKQALATYANARRQLSINERQLYPDVRLVGNYKPVSEGDGNEWFAGIQAGRNVDRFVLNVQAEQQAQQVEAALLQVASTELQINREVLQIHSRLKTLEKEMEIADAQLVLSKERLRLATGLYPSGRTDATQLSDAEKEWVAAQTQKTDVILQQVRARYEYWYVLGMLLKTPEPVIE
ncbi:TolC family protein [Kiritimatiellota bacterium B12222]|nr:TolC family protein [Kiritimatiellota bacterium B12222]